MPEFYKYAERTADSQINWAKIGTDMSTMLQNEEQSREQRKAELDELTNAELRKLVDAPMGLDAEKNKQIGDYSDKISQALLIQNKLLKSGKLNPKDFVIANANAKSSTDKFFNLANQYNKEYAATMERDASNDPKTKSQQLEIFSKGYLENFGDPIVDPVTLNVSVPILSKGKDGTWKPTGKVVPVESVYSGLARKYNYFDSAAAVKKSADQLANVVRVNLKEGSVNEKGQIITIEDALQDSNTVEAMNDFAESYFTNPTNISSILTDDILGYSLTYDEAEAKSDPLKILVKMDNSGLTTPEFTEAQKKVAKDYLITQTKAAIAQKEDIKEFESAQVKKRELAQKDREINIKQQEAETSRINANTAAAKGTTDGTEWETYVNQNVPNLGTGELADDIFIKGLNSNLPGLDLSFAHSDNESIAITDEGTNYAETPYIVKLRNNPNARQEIIDYILVKKANKGKDLIGTGVLNKNVTTPNGAWGKFKGK